MRGLATFISDIRNCRLKELEEKRINKELSNIRIKFSSSLSGYHRMKYTAKLLYMHITGWPSELGYDQAIILIKSMKYSEKRMGYLAITIRVTENKELIKLIQNALAADLNSGNESYICLALCAIANVASKDFADSCVSDILNLLVKRYLFLTQLSSHC